MIYYYYKHDRKNRYKKNETNNNVPESNTLKKVLTLAVPTLGVSVLSYLKTNQTLLQIFSFDRIDKSKPVTQLVHEQY